MAKVIVITPNPLLDYLSGTAVKSGKVSRGPTFDAVTGGKGINVGRILHKHGHHVISMGFAGGNTGKDLMELVRADGVEVAFTPTEARMRVGFQAPSDQGHTSLFETGFAVSASEQDALLKDLETHIDGAELVISGGSVPCPEAVDLLTRITEFCAKAATPCWVDSYGEAMERCTASSAPPALAKPNVQELEGGAVPWDRIPELHISDGPGLVKVRTTAGAWRITPPVVDEVNPIGCGDSYVAGLAHGRLSGLEIPEQLAYAAAAGAANAKRWDIAMIAPEEIAPLVDQVTVVAGAA